MAEPAMVSLFHADTDRATCPTCGHKKKGRVREKPIEVKEVKQINMKKGNLSKPELIFILLNVFMFPIKKNKNGKTSVIALKRFKRLTKAELAARFLHCLQAFKDAGDTMPSTAGFIEQVEAPVQEQVEAPVQEQVEAPVQEQVEAPVQEPEESPSEEEPEESSSQEESSSEEDQGNNDESDGDEA